MAKKLRHIEGLIQYSLFSVAPVVEKELTEEAENARRETICPNWRVCEHEDICFTPQNEQDGICFADEPHRIPAEHRPKFSRDQLKLLAAGYQLIRYTREEKKIEISDDDSDSVDGWIMSGPFPTYAAAERTLKEFKGKGLIETGLSGKIVMSGWNQPGGLTKAGFEFYRCFGFSSYQSTCCIKIGSKNWSNLAKYPDTAALKIAWDELMKDEKALEG